MYLLYQSFNREIGHRRINYMTHFLKWMKNILLFTYTTNILVSLLTVNMKNFLAQKSENVRPNSSNSMENATPL